MEGISRKLVKGVVDKNVFKLNVSMYNPGLVQIPNSIDELGKDTADKRGSQTVAVLTGQIKEVTTAAVIKHDDSLVIRSVFNLKCMKLDNGPVTETSDDVNLPLKTKLDPFFTGTAGWLESHNLDGNKRRMKLTRKISAEDDIAEGTLAKRPNNLVRGGRAVRAGPDADHVLGIEFILRPGSGNVGRDGCSIRASGGNCRGLRDSFHGRVMTDVGLWVDGRVDVTVALGRARDEGGDGRFGRVVRRGRGGGAGGGTSGSTGSSSSSSGGGGG